MTKEELKKKLEKKAEKECVLNDRIHRDCFVSGYLKGALPREKKIAELELKYLRATDEGTSFAHLKSLEGRLAQAKEIIKGLLSCCRNYPQENAEKIKQAEQFLKEKEK